MCGLGTKSGLCSQSMNWEIFFLKQKKRRNCQEKRSRETYVTGTGWGLKSLNYFLSSPFAEGVWQPLLCSIPSCHSSCAHPPVGRQWDYSWLGLFWIVLCFIYSRYMWISSTSSHSVICLSYSLNGVFWRTEVSALVFFKSYLNFSWLFTFPYKYGNEFVNFHFVYMECID